MSPGAPGTPRRAAARGKARDLTRDKVVAAALRLIDRSGAQAITMRGVAGALGVTPMAIYNHFASKRDLLLAVADSVIGATPFDGGHADWRRQVRHCFEALRDLCLRHPGLPRLLEVDGAVPASAFAPMDVTLRALSAAGLNQLDSARTYFLLMGFTLSQAAYQTRPIPGLEPSETVRRERLAGRGYAAAERLEIPPMWDFEASFAFGVGLILDGVEATVSKPSPAKGD